MPTHGVTFSRQTGGLEAIATVEGAAIGVLAHCSVLSEGDLAVVRTAADLTAIDDGSGTIGPVVNAIRKQGSTAPIVVVAVDALNLADASGDAGTFTMAFRLLQAEAEVGIRPRILVQNLVGNIHSDLIAVADRLNAIAYLDGPNTNDTAAITEAGGLSSPRARYSDPAVIDDSDNVVGSSVFFGAIASTQDYWWVPSNRPIQGVKSLSRTIGFVMGDANSQAQLLQDAKVNTIIRQNGWRLWGGLSLGTESQYRFINAKRVEDVLVESIQAAALSFVDQPLDRALGERIVDSVDVFLAGQQARGALLGFNVLINPELNTEANLALGQLAIDYDFTPPPPAHTLAFTSTITSTYLVNITG